MSEARDYEQEARAEGWVPEEEFVGDNPPKEFVDAQEFVERGEKIAPLLNSKVAKQGQVIEELTRKLESITATSDEFREFTQKQMDKERAEKQTLIRELEAKRATAVTEGDGDTFVQTDKQLEELRQQPDHSAHEARAQAWVKDNPWYRDNSEMHDYANSIAAEVESEGYLNKAYFNELTRRTMEKFPKRTQPAAVESDTVSQDSDTKTRTYKSLPADAKAQCDRFVGTIKGFSREEFVANYDWD